MIFAFIALIIASTALLGYMLHRVDALMTAHRAEVKTLVDQIVLLKVDPPMAVTQAMPAPQEARHISSFDDEALANYEAERERLQNETRALIEEFETSEAVAS